MLAEADDEHKVISYVTKAIRSGSISRDVFGLNPVLSALQTAVIAVDEIGLKRDGVISILLYAVAETDEAGLESIRRGTLQDESHYRE